MSIPVRPKSDPKLWKRARVIGLLFIALGIAQAVIATFSVSDTDPGRVGVSYFFAAAWLAVGITQFALASEKRRARRADEAEQRQPAEGDE